MFKARSREHDHWIAKNSNLQGVKETSSEPYRGPRTSFHVALQHLPQELSLLSQWESVCAPCCSWQKKDKIAEATGLGRVQSDQWSRGDTKNNIGMRDSAFLQHWWTCVISRTLKWRKVSQVQRKSGVERWYCEGRFREVRRVYGARCFSVKHDDGKSFGHYFRVTRLFWISKWGRERIHTSRIERRIRNSSSFGKRLSNNLDPNTESKKTTTLWLNWRPSSTAGAQSSLSPIRWTLMGKNNSRKLWLKKGGRKSLGWEGPCFRLELQSFPSVYVDDI